MPVEIERKFLVSSDAWRSRIRRSDHLRQGYIAGSEQCSVRVRILDGEARLGLKSRVSTMRRLEYEYAIPVTEANEIFDQLCVMGRIEKLRHRVPIGSHEWEVDEFLGANQGLIIAEIELQDESEAFVRPPWLGMEVTGDVRYYNTCLAQAPWPTWSEGEPSGRTLR
jgi:adenylate cyclase